MKHIKQTPMTYKREKDKMEISGDPKDIKGHIWFDQLSTWLVRLFPRLLLFMKLPVVSWLSAGWLWIKNKLPYLILFVALDGWLQMYLSG